MHTAGEIGATEPEHGADGAGLGGDQLGVQAHCQLPPLVLPVPQPDQPSQSGTSRYSALNGPQGD